MYVLTDGVTVVEYPYSIEKLRTDNPQVSFPSSLPPRLLAEYGVFVVHEVMPQFDSLLEVAEETGCAYNETTGNWETTFNIRLKTADELQEEAKLKADLIRSERNALLASSDWTQLFDSRVDKEAWGSYRQALRDIPSQTEFPWNVIWPTPPNGS